MRTNGMIREMFLVSVFSPLVLFLGCGGNTNPMSNNGSPTAISVTVSPATASVPVAFAVQFTARVQNDPKNQGVSWSISGNCSGKDCGTIDSTGNYNASPDPHFAPGLLVTATSISDPTKSGTSVVFVTPGPIGVAVSPAVVTVPNGGTQIFNAIGDPLASIPIVTWNVSGSGCAAAACGTIDATGKYIAPASAPNPPSVLVTATSAANPSMSGSATVILGNNPNNAKLKGQYAFLVGGYDGDGAVEMAGSFVADGNGNITSGIGDYNFSSSLFRETNVPFTGAYSVNSDNRGSLSLLVTGKYPTRQTFSFSLSSFAAGVAGRGRIIELDDEQIWTTGILAKQDPSAFSTAAVNGDYAFGFAGLSQTGWPLTENGRFTASEGLLTAGQLDVYGLDVTESGGGAAKSSHASFTGSYEVSANGRGTASGFSNFSFYVISASELFFIEIDTCLGGGECTLKSGVSGAALQQSGGPFTNASLQGADVFHLTAAGSVNGSVAVGIETFDGSGGLAGTKSENNAGVVTTGTEFDGQYSVDSNGLGRGVITLSGDQQPRPFYLVSPGRGFIIDSNSYEAGEFEPQTGGPFGNESISGDYVLGTLPWVFNWVFSPSCGVMTGDGVGNLVGVSDGQDGTGLSFAGTYDLTPNGKASMLITPQGGTPTNWLFYIVSPSKALGIDVDAGSGNKPVIIIEK